MKQSAVRDFSVSEYRKTIKFEYRVYFALIFLISIPLSYFCMDSLLNYEHL